MNAVSIGLKHSQLARNSLQVLHSYMREVAMLQAGLYYFMVSFEVGKEKHVLFCTVQNLFIEF